MQFLDKLERFLNSDDVFIQRFVLHILEDYREVPAEWTEVLLKEAFLSKEKESNIIIRIDNFPFNEESVKLIIERLQKPDNVLYLRLLDNIEPELALKYQKELTPYIKKNNWDI